MHRAQRLLQLLQILRRHRQPVTADVIAAELEVSVRTVYRDVAGLIGDGVPIRGEAGIGYVLEAGYDLPPLMFNADEIEAMLLGMRWVEMRGDSGLARASIDVVAKIEAVLPAHLKPVLLEASVNAPRYAPGAPPDAVDVAALRKAMRERRKVAITYADEKGVVSERTIWPIGLGYFEVSRIIIAWCELRVDFRHFRTDRIRTAEVLAERYAEKRAVLLKRWREGIEVKAEEGVVNGHRRAQARHGQRAGN